MGVQAGAIDATGTTTISGLAGRPECILFLGTNQSVYESAFTPTQGGGFFGWAVEDGSMAIHNYCESAIITTAHCSNLSQNCARMQSAAGSFSANVLYEAQVTDISDSGFTINFSVGSGAHQIHYLAIWGIEPGFVLPYEADCDGDPYTVDVGFTPAVFFTLGNWRGSCHTFPKSTSGSNWNSKTYGDISYYTSVFDEACESVINGAWFSAASDGPFGTQVAIGGTCDPFVLGSICTGVQYVGRTGVPTEIQFEVIGCGGGYDYIHAQFSECFLGNCKERSVGGGGIGSETTVALPSRTSAPEAIIFNNFQDSTGGAGVGAPKRWGAGFATPTYNCGYSISQVGADSFYQSESNSWVSQTTPTAASAGAVDFTPTSDTFSLITQLNGAGSGRIGLMAIQTFCPSGFPFTVALDPLNTSRFIGTWGESRGGSPEATPV